MYAYVMRPETLPKSYWRFIVKSGPVSALVLEAVRRQNRGLPVDFEAVNRFSAECGNEPLLSGPFPLQIPITAFNPRCKCSPINVIQILARP